MYPDFRPRTAITSSNHGQSWLVGFYASEIKDIKVPNLEGGHLYYIINLETNLIKFGLTTNWRSRIKNHIANFVCYAQARPEKLWIVINQRPIDRLEVGEKLWLYLSRHNDHLIHAGGKEFFVYLKDNLYMLDRFFNSLVQLMGGSKSKNISKKVRKSFDVYFNHKSMQ